MGTDVPLWSEETMEEAARVLADALHANEPGTPYDLAEAVLNSAGVRRELLAAPSGDAGEVPVYCATGDYEIARQWAEHPIYGPVPVCSECARCALIDGWYVAPPGRPAAPPSPSSEGSAG